MFKCMYLFIAHGVFYIERTDKDIRLIIWTPVRNGYLFSRTETDENSTLAEFELTL